MTTAEDEKTLRTGVSRARSTAEALNASAASPHDPVAALASGDKVDHYHIIRRIGGGGMGEVYLARDTQLGRRVAIKVVLPSALQSDETVGRFLVEARLTARFNHPHIVTIHGVGEHNGAPYLALEYVKGEDLKARLRGGAMSVPEVLRFGVAIGAALREAHRAGVLHRDLKPSNVLIGEDGRVRVLDFGLAKLFSASPTFWSFGDADTDTPLSDRTFGVGTPKYMAPEQWREEECGTAADVWALGVLLYAMLSRRLPFEHPNLVDQAEAVCLHEETRLESLVTVPTALAEIVHACIRKEPDERPSVASVVERLEELIEGRTTRRSVANPFRGLLPFTQHHAQFFFGRDHEVASFVERLRLQPILPVVGPGGSGKSSFVRAGVLPRLVEQQPWLSLIMRPTARPFHALAARLRNVDLDGASATYPSRDEADAAEGLRDDLGDELIEELSEVRAQLPTVVDYARISTDEPLSTVARLLFESPNQVGIELLAIAQQTGKSVLLFVDQLDELFDLNSDQELITRFLEAIASACDDPGDPVRVVFTVRDDHLGRMAVNPRMREVLSRVTVLQRPDDSALRQILALPVERMGFTYEDEQLVHDMTEAVRGERQRLPLIQFAASQLWDTRDTDNRMLLRSAYEDMGGVQGAIARHADGVLLGMTDEQRALARDILLRMVTHDRHRRIAARERVVEGLGDVGESALERLREARLITTTRITTDKGSETQLELVHSSLIDSWDTLSRWLDEADDDMRFLEDAGLAADMWKKHGRSDEHLWRAAALEEGIRMLARCQAQVPTLTKAFIEASSRRQRRQVQRRRLAYGGILVFTTLAAIGAALVSYYVTEQRDIARAGRAAALREGARAAYAQGDVLEARAKLRAALETEDTTAARALWWQLGREPIWWTAPSDISAFSVAFSPDGKQLATATQDGLVIVYNTMTRAGRRLRGHEDQVIGIAFSPDGSTIASASIDKTVRLWDATSGEPRAVLEGHAQGSHTVAFSHDSKLVAASGYDETVRIFDVGSGKERAVLRGHTGPVRGVAFSPDGKTLASGGADQLVKLWDVASGAPRATLRGHQRELYSVAFSPDGKRLVSGSYDGTVRVWDLATTLQVRAINPGTGPIGGTAFNRDGQLIAVAEADGHVTLWDAATGKLRRSLETPGRPWSLSFHPNGRFLAAGGQGGVRVWDLSVEQLVEQDYGHRQPIDGISFDRAGGRLASSSLDGYARIWNVASGRVQRRVKAHAGAALDVRFSPTEALFATAGSDGTVRLWRDGDATELGVLAGHSAEVYDIAFSRDGQQLVSSSFDRTSRVWNVKERKLTHVLSGHQDRVRGAAFSPDGRRVATPSFDRTISIWDASDGLLITRLTGHEHRVYCADWLNNDEVISASYDGTVRIWNADSGEHRVLIRMDNRIYGVEVSPDGQQILTGGSDAIARIWSLDGRELHRLEGHAKEVNLVRYSRDGSHLATAGDDGTVRVWNADGSALWRAPGIIVPTSGAPLLLTHEGWLELDATARVTSAPTASWAPAVETAEFVSQSPDGEILCVHYGDDVDLYRRGGERVARAHVDQLQTLLATPAGCVILSADNASRITRSGDVEAFDAGGATVANWVDGKLLLAERSRVRVVDDDETIADLPVNAHVTALTLVDGEPVLGFQDGSIERRTGDGVLAFESTPSSPVERLVAGPAFTVLAGYAGGTVGIWDANSGKRLAAQYLHGQVRHVVQVDHVVYIASDLGQHMRWDLEPFYLTRCQLLEAVREHVPITWQDGRAILAPPPTGECR